jgi:hypothetical protein
MGTLEDGPDLYKKFRDRKDGCIKGGAEALVRTERR